MEGRRNVEDIGEKAVGDDDDANLTLSSVCWEGSLWPKGCNVGVLK